MMQRGTNHLPANQRSLSYPAANHSQGQLTDDAIVINGLRVNPCFTLIKCVTSSFFWSIFLEDLYLYISHMKKSIDPVLMRTGEV